LARAAASMALRCCATRLPRSFDEISSTLLAPEGRVQRGRIGVVGAAHLHALRGQVGRLGRVAHGGDDLRCRGGFEQVGNDQAAQLAGCCGDDNHGILRLKVDGAII
jgi:hypothetical protein